MWIFESDGAEFDRKKLWLRPGQTYLFGRTASEPGEFAISDKTVSRTHMKISVEEVPEGGGRDFRSRSKVIVEDLETKKGTTVNGTQIRATRHVIIQDENEIKMGLCSRRFRLHWHNILFSFSFTSKELRQDPWAILRDQLEQLDIKYSAEYERALTSHVVSKKRNTSKTLLALIDGRYIVIDSFITALLDAASVSGEAPKGTKSALELDFDGQWPNAIEHLPPRGEEPTDSPAEAYSPDDRRKEVFDGYTFVFYEKKQFDNLQSVIAEGKGKALLKEAVAAETQVDDFVRYVKEVAGEKGLGSFEDGSEGQGVVVVRYIPSKGSDYDWFAQFYTSVALALDHRPIDQKEFLEAILAGDASMLRRPLPVASQSESEMARSQQRHTQREQNDGTEAGGPQASAEEPAASASAPTAATQTTRGRSRREIRSRFKGFDLDSDPEDPPRAPQDSLPSPASQETGVGAGRASQAATAVAERLGTGEARTSRRKRALSPVAQLDLMDGLAPTAAAAKRRRIAAGEDLTPSSSAVNPPADDADDALVPESPQPGSKSQPAKGRGRKAKPPDEILEAAKRHREEEERRAAAEREELAQLPDDGIDYDAIRRMAIVEEATVRQPQTERTREEDIAEGRWDPRWNGRQNFKRFRKQGDPQGRRPEKVIVSLVEVKTKEYGISDDYWLEEAEEARKKQKEKEKREKASAGQPTSQPQAPPVLPPAQPARGIIDVDSSDEDYEEPPPDEMEEESQAPLSRTRAAKSAERANVRRSQTQTQSQRADTQPSQATRSGKRAASGPPAKEQPAKKPRQTRASKKIDDEEGGLTFQFD